MGSYINELREHSSKKKFYVNILKDGNLTLENVPNLLAMLTHLGLGLCGRKQVRNDVDISAFRELKDKILGVVDTILSDGSAPNVFKKILE